MKVSYLEKTISHHQNRLKLPNLWQGEDKIHREALLWMAWHRQWLEFNLVLLTHQAGSYLGLNVFVYPWPEVSGRLLLTWVARLLGVMTLLHELAAKIALLGHVHPPPLGEE